MNTDKTGEKSLWTLGTAVIGTGAIAAAIAVALPTLLQITASVAPLAA